MPITNEAYISRLETEKNQLLAQLENYAKEQKAKVIIFHDQEKLLDQKDKQLAAQEQQLGESEALITKLKARIHQLAKTKKTYAATIESGTESSDNETIIKTPKTYATTQTEGITPNELEEQLLAKRLANLKEFGAYHEQLQAQDKLISKLQQRVIAYQRQLKALPNHANQQEKNTLIIFLLVVLTSTLFLK